MSNHPFFSLVDTWDQISPEGREAIRTVRSHQPDLFPDWHVIDVLDRWDILSAEDQRGLRARYEMSRQDRGSRSRPLPRGGRYGGGGSSYRRRQRGFGNAEYDSDESDDSEHGYGYRGRRGHN